MLDAELCWSDPKSNSETKVNILAQYLIGFLMCLDFFNYYLQFLETIRFLRGWKIAYDAYGRTLKYAWRTSNIKDSTVLYVHFNNNFNNAYIPLCDRYFCDRNQRVVGEFPGECKKKKKINQQNH